jgi:hypothetical protein
MRFSAAFQTFNELIMEAAFLTAGMTGTPLVQPITTGGSAVAPISQLVPITGWISVVLKDQQSIQAVACILRAEISFPGFVGKEKDYVHPMAVKVYMNSLNTITPGTWTVSVGG